MNCQQCDRCKGIARCEGCGVLFCFSCLNEHQNTLEKKFHELIDERNRLVEQFNGKENRMNFDQISADLREKQKQKYFLENEIEDLKQRLETLRKNLSRVDRIDVCQLVPDLKPSFTEKTDRSVTKYPKLSVLIDKISTSSKFPQKSTCSHCHSIFLRIDASLTCHFCRDVLLLSVPVK